MESRRLMWVRGKTLEENVGRNLEGLPSDWVAECVELALRGTFASFQVFQHLSLAKDASWEFVDAPLKFFNVHARYVDGYTSVSAVKIYIFGHYSRWRAVSIVEEERGWNWPRR
jgi:hypothetical protein